MSPVPAGSEPFALRVLSPKGLAYEGQILSLILPTRSGRLGVLSHHAPLVAILDLGEVQFRLRVGGHFKGLDITGGFAEVRDGVVTVVADDVLSTLHETEVDV